MPDDAALRGTGLAATIVHACRRDGRGGSPTAVLDEAPMTDEQRCAVPGLTGASHAVFVSARDAGDGTLDVALRFFTSAGELPACGHGTVAALAYLADRGGVDVEAAVRTPARSFAGRAGAVDGSFAASFDPGRVDRCEPAGREHDRVVDTLGLGPGGLASGVTAAALGRPRLLVPVTTRPALAALAPDFARLREACDDLGLLGCYAYTVPDDAGRVAARMFAPSIGVPEDIANANSTACLAAHLAARGITSLTSDMGDSLGSPATITASSTPGAPGAPGPLVSVGGTAAIGGVVVL
ncbi:PhzF family phenazine biosynthesis protein [Yinghuangia seranimata]|uniref:PhzF family phenazine biosynthesis protein n=1 Tax=Yinghuangia seranimata TaxID=408067 RepID=UPI00248CC10C|nr:PhzF family phenazine biosynthesis protein [Yinghuangia seranimata]MDI2125547.1 PhzF family phenazine biosynthesis protein [Yinghuangia seranimata]